ncbi:hypothetical protein P9E34_19545 [Schinkia azotoformans]|uniref:hypothetical protein n=1 Tax=Schinkia azotoformans TaxID=1454 RepID=UPI002DBA5399|nr:hypothetical protein [Schinkia azotoformans]MEC1726908.1 hypothetical protein [Schinkia azotoformans]
MLLDYVDFISGAISVGVAYAMFKGNDDEIIINDDDNEDFEDNEEGSGRLVTMSCQGCRKLKKHKEVKHNLYQCTKCKRLVDLR